jgi:hypothetical protein
MARDYFFFLAYIKNKIIFKKILVLYIYFIPKIDYNLFIYKYIFKKKYFSSIFFINYI